MQHTTCCRAIEATPPSGIVHSSHLMHMMHDFWNATVLSQQHRRRDAESIQLSTSDVQKVSTLFSFRTYYSSCLYRSKSAETFRMFPPCVCVCVSRFTKCNILPHVQQATAHLRVYLVEHQQETVFPRLHCRPRDYWAFPADTSCSLLAVDYLRISFAFSRQGLHSMNTLRPS